MNKQNFSALVLASVVAFNANADIIGVTTGADFWYADAKINDVRADDAKLQPSVYLAIEHFLPLIPNGKIRYTGIESVDTKGFNTDFDQYDLIAYYEILDNDVLSLDLGLNFQHYTGTFQGKSFDEWQPALYANGAVGLPGLNLSAFASFSVGDFDGSKTTDAEAGIAFSLIDFFPLSIDLKAGYRIIDHDFDFFSVPSRIVYDGFFFGVEVDI